MKKLTKAGIDTLRVQMPLLDEIMQRGIIGGCGNYGSSNPNHCFFYCMEYMYNSFGGTNGHTSGDFANAYYAETYAQCGCMDYWGNGMHADHADGVLGAYFNYTNADPSKIGCGAIGSGRYMAIINNNSHSVMITDVCNGVAKYYDPQNNTTGSVSVSSINKLYNVSSMNGDY